jgi:enoyl-CoA hydratase/carnithine racemase
VSGTITIERDERGVGALWIDTPDHRNAMNNGLIDALIAGYGQLGLDDACGIVMLRGRGGLFCAGRELRDLRELNQSPLDRVEAACEFGRWGPIVKASGATI